MGTYWIRAALGGGFGGVESAEWEEVEAASLDEALEEAWRRATEVYESYEGLYGLRCISEIMEDEECDEEEAADIYAEERDNWLDYEATDKRPEGIQPPCRIARSRSCTTKSRTPAYGTGLKMPTGGMNHFHRRTPPHERPPYREAGVRRDEPIRRNERAVHGPCGGAGRN